jgi:PAS domain S-box-containing protein
MSEMNHKESENQHLKELIRELEKKVADQEKLIEELSYEKDLFDNLMENVPDSIYFKDKESRFIRISEAKAKRHELNNTADYKGKTDADFFAPNSAEEFLKDEQRIIKTGYPVIEKEENITWLDGRKRWMSTTKVPLLNKKGKIMGTMGVSRDITKIKLAEKYMQNRMENLMLEQLQTLMDNIPDRIFFKDHKSRFIRVNKACAAKTGLKPEEMIGKTDFDIASKEFAQQTFEEEKRILETGEPLIGKEEYYTFRKAVAKWVSVIKLPFRDINGKIIGTFGVSRDITKLKSLEYQLQFLIDNMPEKVFFKDEKSRFLRINKAAAESMKIQDPVEAMGKTDFDYFSPEFAKETLDDERRIIETGKPIVRKQVREVWPEGGEKWVSTTKLPLRDVDGKIIGTCGISSDITPLKKA